MKPNINTIYVTKVNQKVPIMIYQLNQDEGLEIDIHVQYMEFTSGTHTFAMHVEDQNKNILLENGTEKIKFPDFRSNNFGLGEVVLFLTTDSNEIKGVNYVDITITVDHTLFSDYRLYLNGGDTIG
jgi:hypothetical protein